jgi:hypothetical protein
VTIKSKSKTVKAKKRARPSAFQCIPKHRLAAVERNITAWIEDYVDQWFGEPARVTFDKNIMRNEDVAIIRIGKRKPFVMTILPRMAMNANDHTIGRDTGGAMVMSGIFGKAKLRNRERYLRTVGEIRARVAEFESMNGARSMEPSA